MPPPPPTPSKACDVVGRELLFDGRKVGTEDRDRGGGAGAVKVMQHMLCLHHCLQTTLKAKRPQTLRSGEAQRCLIIWGKA